MSSVLLQRIIQQISVWSAIPVIGLLFWLNEWSYYVAAVLALILISKFGASIGQHRYFSHKAFRMDGTRESVIAVLATLSTTGTILQYSTVHRYHHGNSDNGKDIHSPHEIGYWRSFWHWYVVDPTTLVPLSTIKDLLRKPLIVWLHKYYFAVIAFYVIVLAAIDPYLVLFCYLLPVAFSWWSSAVLSLPLHVQGHGYRNFNTNDQTVNSHLWNWLTLGEGLHNNHHARPGEYDFAFTRKPGEWDFSARLVDIFLK